MIAQEFLDKSVKDLANAGVYTARLDCLVLLEDAIGKDRGWLLAHPEYALQALALKRLTSQIERRLKHEPLAYIRGKSEFYGREFIVSADTLQPRPESETMIELALEVMGSRFEVREKTRYILDIGTGCGALGITLKLEVPDAIVVATDISGKCLKIAEQNAIKLNAKVKFYTGDLLQPIYNLAPITYNLVVANLPYVSDSHTINQSAMFEPRRAIFGGLDGLDLYRRLFRQVLELAVPPLYILTESLPFQHKPLAQIAKSSDYHLQQTSDFIQVFKQVSKA